MACGQVSEIARGRRSLELPFGPKEEAARAEGATGRAVVLAARLAAFPDPETFLRMIFV